MVSFFDNPATVIDAAQLTFAVIGGAFGLYMLQQKTMTERNAGILNIYEKIYGDAEIRRILYLSDSDSEERKEIAYKGVLEREADKTLRFLELIARMQQSKKLKRADIELFRYEILAITDDEYIQSYIEHLEEHGLRFDNLKALVEDLRR